jgi:hypothetical protein
MIPTGRFNSKSKPEIGEAWDFKVAETEKSMLLSWLDAPSVPLKNSAWDFEVQKIRTINKVFEMAWSDDYQGGQGGPPVSSSELWVETADRFAGCFIDSVEETNQELILRDFKSGLINVYGSDSSEVKPEYVAQLELYCAIFFESVDPAQCVLSRLKNSHAFCSVYWNSDGITRDGYDLQGVCPATPCRFY